MADPSTIPSGADEATDDADAADAADAPGSAIKEALVEAGESPPANLFVLPHPGVVIFPDLVAPVVLKGSLAARTVEQASTQTRFIGCLLATETESEEFDPAQVRTVGCAARVIRTLRLPDGTQSVVLRGLKRFTVERWLRTRPYLIARVAYPDEPRGDTPESLAMMRVLQGLLKKILASDGSVPDEFKLAAANIDAPRGLADFAATYFVRNIDARQDLLDTLDVQDRLEKIITILTREVGLLELGQRIQEQIRQRLEKQQRDFFLREQLKEIQKELGEAKDEKTVAIEQFEARLRGRDLPEAVAARIDEELQRLRILPLESPESAVIRNYLDWLTRLPWNEVTDDRTDLVEAERILNAGHHGIDEVKQRILEFLAVRKLKKDHRGPILCFVGPPGVGKTSLGQAIAQCLGRKFVRISLGGMRDEAEIRGHRRTYVGAMPGRIVQGLKQAGSSNPVFMLDEIDKIGVDFRGDPAAALLEVLDPEQNHTFSDHYLEIPVDLTRVMFIATANTLTTVPQALQDRLEVIPLAGYTGREKIEIAKRFLLPRQLERHGLEKAKVSITTPALREIVHRWTREAGVRNLEQMLARVCRKVASQRARKKSMRPLRIGPERLDEFLGPARFEDEKALSTDRPGIAVGLAWTPVGGQALSVEAMATPGTGQFTLTGMLGDVMLESARIALTHVRATIASYGVKADFAKTDIHVHVPAGAVPKDGPSAGITIATALLSLLRGVRVRPRLAMTGELTLTGRVLPVGGIRDKVLAARRAGLPEVILPAGNRPQVGELPEENRRGLRFHFVEDFASVAKIAFGTADLPAPPRRKRRRARSAGQQET